jgi:hypothetical protein
MKNYPPFCLVFEHDRYSENKLYHLIYYRYKKKPSGATSVHTNVLLYLNCSGEMTNYVGFLTYYICTVKEMSMYSNGKTLITDVK